MADEAGQEPVVTVTILDFKLSLKETLEEIRRRRLAEIEAAKIPAPFSAWRQS